MFFFDIIEIENKGKKVEMKNSSSFFRNCECEHFPCHKVTDTQDFNCLFCYCPLYSLDNCGGNFTFNEKGLKDCSNCLLPHKAQNYEWVVSKLKK